MQQGAALFGRRELPADRRSHLQAPATKIHEIVNTPECDEERRIWLPLFTLSGFGSRLVENRLLLRLVASDVDGFRRLPRRSSLCLLVCFDEAGCWTRQSASAVDCVRPSDLKEQLSAIAKEKCTPGNFRDPC